MAIKKLATNACSTLSAGKRLSRSAGYTFERRLENSYHKLSSKQKVRAEASSSVRMQGDFHQFFGSYVREVWKQATRGRMDGLTCQLPTLIDTISYYYEGVSKLE